MPNENYIQHLKLGLDHWNRWRLAEPSTVPDLVEADLRAREFDGIPAGLTFLAHEPSMLNSIARESATLDGILPDGILAIWLPSRCAMGAPSRRNNWLSADGTSIATLRRDYPPAPIWCFSFQLFGGSQAILGQRGSAGAEDNE